MIRPGEASGWGSNPAIWSGPTGPLQWDFPAQIETPYVQSVGLGPILTPRNWGFPAADMPPGSNWNNLFEWARGPDQDWGLGDQSELYDSFLRHQSPASSPEAIHWIDVQRCVEIPTLVLSPAGVTFELVHFDVPTASIGIVERTPTIFDRIVALDENAEPIFDFSGVNGERPCLSEIQHPNQGVLRWRWDITITETPGTGPGTNEAYVGPVTPLGIQGLRAMPSWDDLRRGSERMWAFDEKIIVPEHRLVRYWVTIFADPALWDITVGARLAGYWQHCGRRGAALASADRRYGA